MKINTYLCVIFLFSSISCSTIQRFTNRTNLTEYAEKTPLEMVVQQGHKGRISSMAVSPDGRYIATGSAWGEYSIKLWTTDGKLIRTIKGHKDIVRSVSFSPDGKYILSGAGYYRLELGSSDNTVKLWSIDGRLIKSFIGDSCAVSFVAFSPDGKYIAAGGISKREFGEEKVKLWSLNGDFIRSFDDYSEGGIAFSPDGKNIAYTSGKEIRLCSIDGKLIRILKGHSDSVSCIAFSPDGEYIISSSNQVWMGKNENSIRVWSINGKLIKTLKGHSKGIAGLSISRDGQYMASISNDSARIWRINGDLLKTVKVNGYEFNQDTRISFTPDGKHVVFTEQDKDTKQSIIKVMDMDGRQVRSFKGYEFNSPSIITLNANGRFIAYKTGKIVELRSLNGKLIKTMNHDADYISFSPDYRYIATASFVKEKFGNYNIVNLWSMKGKLVKTFKSDYGNISFSPDGKYIVCSSSENVSLYSMNGKLVKKFKGHSSISFSPTGKHIALSFGDTIRIINSEGAVISTIEEYFGRNKTVVFGPDGKHVASISLDRNISIWSINGQLIREIKAHSAPIDYLYLSSDSKYIVTSSQDRTIKIWSIEGKLIKTIDGGYMRSGWRNIISFSERDSLIAYISKGNINTIIIYNIETDEHISLLSSGNDWIFFTPDGYFDCSSNGGRLIAMRRGLDTFGVDQFAIIRNRPDIILKRLGYGDRELIDSFYYQYRKRLKKSGIAGEKQPAEFHVPMAKITDNRQKGKFAEVTFNLRDSKYSLKSYNLYVNDVPLFGGQGKEIKGNDVTITERVELGFGVNKIEVSCINEKGAESYRALAFADFNKKTRTNLYYIGFGVSNYKNSDLNLGFAHQDAIDLARAFRKMEGNRFNRVYCKTFIDEYVTVENIKNAKSFLRGAQVDDTFILFIAGHGMHDRDNESTYYYLTHESDEKNLPASAAKFELVEDILHGIAPRHKLFLMDTCESGELDDAVLTNLQSVERKNRGVRARTIRKAKDSRALEIKKKKKKRGHLLERNRFIYNDLFRRSGSIVFSSCKGDEVSYEEEELQNGFFTEAIIRALADIKTDKNNDGIISTEELRDYVIREVPRICRQFDYKQNEEQHPTVDRDNIHLRFGFPSLNNNYQLINALKEGDVLAARRLIKRGSNVNIRDMSGSTPLHWAALNGKGEIARFLIEKGAKVNAKDEFDNTPLHRAAESGHTELVKLLLKKGADIDARNNEEEKQYHKSEKTPLHKAVENGKIAAAIFLVNKGANINAKCSYKKIKGITPLHIAAENGYIRLIEVLLQKGADINGNVTTYNLGKPLDTPLYRALKNERRESARMLIKKGAKINQKNSAILHAAVDKGYIDLTKLLLEKGADIDAQYSFSSVYNGTYEERFKEKTPLHISIMFANLEMVRLLAEKGADVNLKIWNKYPKITPLHIAAQYGNAEIVRLLIDKGADINTINNDRRYNSHWQGDLPLHIAARLGNTEAARMLIDKGADVNAKNINGRTSLHLVADKKDITRLLVDKGANINAKDAYGGTPLHYAAEDGKIQVVRLLIDRGADINAKANNGLTPVQAAGKNIAIARLLVENGADIKVKDKWDFTTLHHVIYDHSDYRCDDCKDFVILLIKKGADVFLRDDKGNTPLHLTGMKGNVEIAEILMDMNADKNAKNKTGDTPLHLASREGRLEFVRFLIDKGAHVNVKNNRGNTPLHEAAAREGRGVMELLVERGADLNAKNREGIVPLSLYITKKDALSIQDIERPISDRVIGALYLIEKGANVNVKANDGNSPLHMAASKGLSGLCRLLIDNGADLNAGNNNGDTPLHRAAGKVREIVTVNDYESVEEKIDRCHLITARLLLKRGADINIKNKQGITPFKVRNDKGKTILHTAVIHDTLESIAFFIDKGADINAKDKDGNTALHESLNNNRREVAHLLIERGADINAKDKNEYTPLHTALNRIMPETSSLIIERGADVTIKDKQGNTPLHLALSSYIYFKFRSANGNTVNEGDNTSIEKKLKRQLEVIRLLIKRGTDLNANNRWGKKPLQVQSGNGYTILHSLVDRRGNLKDIAFFVEKGADINAKNELGYTPLHLAAYQGLIEEAGFLIDKGADVNSRTNYNVTPLHWALSEGKFKIARLLIKKGADVNAKDSKGCTPLHRVATNGLYRKSSRDSKAVKKPDISLFQLLIKRGSRINAKDSKGDTPLHKAVYKGQLEVIQLLIKSGANKNIRNKDGKKPDDYAKREEIRRLLKQGR